MGNPTKIGGDNIQKVAVMSTTGDSTLDVNVVSQVSSTDGVDANNSTVTPLTAGATFTGAFVDVDQKGEIKVAYSSDVNDSQCYIELSNDGITVNTSLFLPPQLQPDGKYGAIHQIDPSLPYYRVRYVNGASNQTFFYITTILLKVTGNGFVFRSTQVLDRFTDVKIVRSINDPSFDRNLGLVNYITSNRKFGINEAVGNTALEYINPSGLYTFPTTAQTIRIQAGGNSNDSAGGSGAQTIEVFFLDENWNQVSEILTTNGALASLTTTALAIRVNSVKVRDVGTYHGSNTGDIIIEQSTSGIELAEIPADIGTTTQTILSVPNGFDAYVSSVFVSVGQNNSADLKLFEVTNADDITTPYTAKHEEWGIEDYSGADRFQLDTRLKFEAKTDVWIMGQRITGSGSARISADFDYDLVENG